MRCPYCKEDKDKVIDSRSCTDLQVIRRRRECLHCGKRFTTYERVEENPIRVVKKDGRRESFDQRKLRQGILLACGKRPVPMEKVDEMVRKIEERIAAKYDREVPSRVIGQLVMKELKKVDSVAYVRFASVYREFQDLEDFLEEVEKAKSGRKDREAEET